MSEFSIPPSVTPESVLAAIILLILGVIIGMITDRKKFKYQTKSNAKIVLLSSIYRAIGAYDELEIALKQNSMNDDQWGQLRHFADLINQANSKVKALGIESKSLSEDVQLLITKMGNLGRKIKNCEKKPNIKKMKAMATEGSEVMVFAINLVDKLRSEFQKKKYVLF